MSNDDLILIDAGVEVLKRYAAHGGQLTYGELNRELGSPIKHGGNFPGQIGRLCDAINRRHAEVTGKEFMISVLVRNGDTGQPGPGFFELAATLQLLAPTEDEKAKRDFVDRQQRAVHAVYRATRSGPGAQGNGRHRKV
ncbi:hypothetical protein [Glycomyces sp. NPDC047010]|uniref:hypothetical protein n=1 Tax=Glycomyces sp. NPDC047010 TaxID=3155023 RepID=UPI0033C46015